ncbi:MAG TPA: site-2 protease family protein [Humisphaera sp.]|jgi:Zn-dependent protease|nr:site-2 protease family protein [Humisphaera sp.]
MDDDEAGNAAPAAAEFGQPPVMPPAMPPPLPPSPPPLPSRELVPQAGVIYKLDSSKASFAELARDSRGAGRVFVFTSKVFRMRLPGSVNDPNVESLRPFEVAFESFPPDVAARIESSLAELSAAGFDVRNRICHLIVDLYHRSSIFIVSVTRADGKAVARVFLRREGSAVVPKTHFYVDLLTELLDGRFLWTTGAKAILSAPGQVQVQQIAGAPPARLAAAHQQRLDLLPAGAQVRGVPDREAMAQLLERHHVQIRDFHLQRKMFVPMSDADRRHAATLNDAYTQADSTGLADPAVYAEMERLQNKQTSWVGGIFVLIASLVVFLAAGATGNDGWFSGGQNREVLILLVGVLFFHEFGHYVAMKVFRYRNVRMFFIPLFGAAVSGTNYSAPGWKKVIVALMGPLPGIFIGGALGIAGLYWHRPMLVKIAMMSLILNGSNLLPVLPLDGGRVMQALLFSRHYIADVLFRLIAALALIGIGLASGGKFFIYLGIAMILAVPLTWRLGRIAAALKQSGFQPPPPDSQRIPPHIAQLIIDRIKGSSMKGVKANNRTMAQHALTVYESLCSRSPGWLATIGLAALHIGSLVIALVLALVLAFAQGGKLSRFARAAVSQPQQTVSSNQIVYAASGEQDAAEWNGPRKTIYVNFDKIPQAVAAFDDWQSSLQAGEELERFGQSVLICFPASDDRARLRWIGLIEPRSRQFGVSDEKGYGGANFRLTCVAPTFDAADKMDKELNEYFRLPNQLYLIPPWSAAAASNRWDQFRLARSTYVKMRDAGRSVRKDPRIADLSKRAREALRRGERDEYERLNDQRRKIQQEADDAEQKRIAALTDGSIDPVTASLYLALPKPTTMPAEDDDLVADWQSRFKSPAYQALAARMGQIELAGGNPVHRSNRFSSEFALVGHESLLISIRYTRFDDPAEGWRALVQWLESRGFKNIRYEIKFVDDAGMND